MLLYIFIPILYANLAVCNPSVIIVGAGASGIAAATKLLKNDLTNITVLEAEDRIGGRIYSVPFGTGYVDLGAEWCHGEKDNIVFEMVKNLNILRSNSNKKYLQMYHSKLKLLDQNFSDALMNIFADLHDKSGTDSANLGDYLTKRYEAEISSWKNDTNKYGLARQALNLFESFVISNEGAFSWFDVATNADFVVSEGDYALHWNGLGYKTVLEVLQQKYPDPSKSLPIDDKILLNKEVKQIHWNSEQALVKCTDGSIYSADHVIVTVSLGVLKHQHADLFEPKLPANKVEAIDQLGFAAVHKVLLHFPEKWWNDSYSGSTFIWDEDDKQLFKEGPIKNGKSWLTALSSLSPTEHNPNVLEAWLTGNFVPDIEKISNEVFINGIMYLLEFFQVTGAQSLVRPDGIARYNWYNNPNFRGTYSFQTPLTHYGPASDETILSIPLGRNAQMPSLLFAGEATNSIHYSTVHGAIESGFREAERLIKLYS